MNLKYRDRKDGSVVTRCYVGFRDVIVISVALRWENVRVGGYDRGGDGAMN